MRYGRVTRLKWISQCEVVATNEEKIMRYIHRLSCDIFNPSVQFELEGSDELEEESFHPTEL
jgi:hypothetical protein